MTDDIIHSTKYYIKYISSAIFVNLRQKPLKLGRLIVLNATHQHPRQFPLPWQPTLFQSLQPDFNILVVLSLEDIKHGHELKLTYFNACWITRQRTIGSKQYRMLHVAGKTFNIVEAWNPVCCHGDKSCQLIMQSTSSRTLL